MKDATINKDVIIGGLGGVPVDLPSKLVHLVEYDGDSDWGEALQGDIPKITYQSKINSFGFDIRYTDGVIYDGIIGKMADEYDAQKNLSDSPWVSVGINSGNRYYGTGGIHRIGDRVVNNTRNQHPLYTYKKLPEPQHRLDVYTSSGINLKTNTPWREDSHAKDIFIKRNSKGNIITYIECSNNDVSHPPCTHYFDLEPELGVDIYMSYSRYVLEDWQQIEQVITKAILAFKK